jgi:hypothetical protein
VKHSNDGRETSGHDAEGVPAPTSAFDRKDRA